jgi:hypothetical protein
LEYAATTPLDKAEEQLAVEQLTLREKLWARLLPVEVRRREELETLLYGRALTDEIAGVQAAIHQLYVARRKATEKGSFAPRIASAERQRAELFAQAERVSAQRLDETAPLWNEIQRRNWGEVRAAAREAIANGLGHDNADDLLISYRVSRQQAALHHCELRPAPTASRISVSWPNGLPVEQMLNGNDRFQLTRTSAAIRVRTNGNGEPAWLRIPISMERPLPWGKRIRQVYAVRTPAKPRASWHLVITLNEGKEEK